MTEARTYDIVCLSAAAVDINVGITDADIAAHGLNKGLTSAITSGTLARILENATDITRTPGSPGANVAIGVALRGGKTALIGKVGQDEHGDFFAQRLQSHGVDYIPVQSADGHATTQIVVMVTPDKERSFAHLGAAGLEIAPNEADASLFAQAKIAYIDSYLWLSDTGRATAQHMAQAAKNAGCQVAFALNDAGLIAHNRTGFLQMVVAHADILLGDRNEFAALFGTQTFEETVDAIKALGLTASITAGAAGAHVIEDGAVTHIPTKKIEKIVDTCGAGDQFAAGFLYGLSQGKTAEASGHIGAQWAADVIQHKGAEPQVGRNAPKNPPKGPRL